MASSTYMKLRANVDSYLDHTGNQSIMTLETNIKVATRMHLISDNECDSLLMLLEESIYEEN